MFWSFQSEFRQAMVAARIAAAAQCDQSLQRAMDRQYQQWCVAANRLALVTVRRTGGESIRESRLLPKAATLAPDWAEQIVLPVIRQLSDQRDSMEHAVFAAATNAVRDQLQSRWHEVRDRGAILSNAVELPGRFRRAITSRSIAHNRL